MLTDDIDDIPASSKRVPLPLQVGVRMPASAAKGHVPLQFLAPKKPWDKPKVKKFSPEIVAEELAAEAEALANAKPEEPPPLGDADFELIDAFARKAQRMDALGQIDHAKNVARAAALLRAEAWRRTHEDTSHKRGHSKKKATKVKDSTDYWDPTRLGAHLDHITAEGDAAATKGRPPPLTVQESSVSERRGGTPQSQREHPPPSAGSQSARERIPRPPTSASSSRPPHSARSSVPVRPMVLPSPATTAATPRPPPTPRSGPAGTRKNELPPAPELQELPPDLDLADGPRAAGKIIGDAAAEVKRMLEEVETWRGRRLSSTAGGAGVDALLLTKQQQ